MNQYRDISRTTKMHAGSEQDSLYRRIAMMVVWVVLRTGATVKMVFCISGVWY